KERKQQVGCYSPGVGTGADQKTQDEIKAAQPHQIFLPEIKPNLITCSMGTLFGYGLKKNIHYLYDALVDNYEKDDQIFMFGFSRGAFTVRALAGLLRRCGLLLRDK